MIRRTLSIVALLGIVACSPPLAPRRPLPPHHAPPLPRLGDVDSVLATRATASILPNQKDSVKFAVIGDTGTGGSAQYQVGKLLNDARARFPYDFVIMMGDNMYGGRDRRTSSRSSRRRTSRSSTPASSSTRRSVTTTTPRSASTSRSTWTASATTRSARATSSSSFSTAPT